MNTKNLLVLLLAFGFNTVDAQQAITNSIGMEFIRIEPGSMVAGEFKPPYPVPDDTVKGATHPYVMWMGEGRGYNEEEFSLAKEMATRDARRGFEVRLTKTYYIGKFEVTQQQWKKL